MRGAGVFAEWGGLWGGPLAPLGADVVDLEGGVGDTVLAGEEVFEVAAASVAVFALADEDVGGEGREAGGDGPDVEVVDLHHALCGGHLAACFFSVYAAGGRFQE